jgi:hypothetical protein
MTNVQLVYLALGFGTLGLIGFFLTLIVTSWKPQRVTLRVWERIELGCIYGSLASCYAFLYITAKLAGVI